MWTVRGREEIRGGKDAVAIAQCGLSEDENQTSIGAILRLGGQRFSDLIDAIVRDALARLARRGP